MSHAPIVAATAAAAPAVFLGLKLYELLTLVGIVIGPIVAVVITLVVERLRSKRERQLNVFRALIATFRLSSDANYSVAMNMILVEFNGNKAVMEARREYMNVVRQRAAPGNEQALVDQMVIKQIALVFIVAKSLGFKITEGELRSEAYIAEGMLARDNLLLDSQKAMRDLANAQQRIADMVAEAVAKNNPPPQPGPNP